MPEIRHLTPALSPVEAEREKKRGRGIVHRKFGDADKNDKPDRLNFGSVTGARRSRRFNVHHGTRAGEI